MMEKQLTYKEFIELAKKNYCHGGMDICECWDEFVFNEYVKEFGPMTVKAAKSMMGLYEAANKEQEAMSHWE